MKTIGNKASVMSALESALAALPDKQIRRDEFTAEQFIAAKQKEGDQRTHNGLRAALLTLEKRGVLKCRKVCVDGKHRNAYSKA
jgi:hypothetical protein